MTALWIKMRLLWKAWRGERLTSFDIDLAHAVCGTYPLGAPTWLVMIANMKMETTLPEAWVEFRLGLEESFVEWANAWLE